MSIHINEIKNDKIPNLKPIREIMSIQIPDIIDGVPNRNGFIWVLAGSGGSGKSSLLLNFFKSEKLYKNKFSNIFYICPESSFLSVENHPFSKHDPEKIFHELNSETLETIYDRLNEIKKENAECEPEDYQYNICIFDDVADKCKDAEVLKMLNKMLIKARHISCAFVFVVQSYYLYPKICRKQITNITIFKPKNAEEWDSITKELLHMKKDNGLILYDYVFSEPYNHLDIDTVNDKLYKNFNLLEISK